MNNQINFSGGKQTMSSREISELAGKKHKNVLRDIDALNENYRNMGMLKIEQGYYTTKNTGSQEHREYLLTKIQTLDLMTGYNPELRIRINRRWEQLEKENINRMELPDFRNPAESARAWADLYEVNSLQNREIKEIAPKAEYFDKVLQSNSTYVTNQIAKEMGMSAVTLNRMLKDLKIQYKQNGTWLLYKKYEDKGYTETKTYTFSGSDGQPKTSMQTVWTEKGRKLIHELIQVPK